MLDLGVWWVCLALNVYHEARNEDYKAQIAVALVTLNRAQYRKDRICREVFRYKQFSWTLKDDWAPQNARVWKRSIRIAHLAFKIEDFTRGATHFHTLKVRPYWARSAWGCDKAWTGKPKMELIGKWGNHIFYQEIRRQ